MAMSSTDESDGERACAVPIAVAVLGVVLWPAAGAAQTCTTKDAADQLFHDARLLTESRDHESACARFEASQRLDPALGTLLNLAVCHEELGRWERALALYRSVEAMAVETEDGQRAGFASEAASKLEKRMPRLVLRVDGERPGGLVVARNGQQMADDQFDRLVPVDAGLHVIVATAPGHRPFVARVLTGPETGETAVAIAMEPLVAVADVPRQAAPGGDKFRTLGLVATGVGGAAVAAGLVSGGLAWRTWDSAFERAGCSAETYTCTEVGQERVRAANTHADMSTGLVGAGLVVVGAGVALYLLAPRLARRKGLIVAPAADAERAFLSLSGAF